MRRFTILGVMGFVLVLAVGLAALRGANDYWAGGFLTTTPLLFCLALLGALCGRPEKRPGRLGFVVLGGGYFALAFLGLSDANLNKLPTSQALYYVHQKVVGTQTVTVLFSTAGTGMGPTTSVARGVAWAQTSGTFVLNQPTGAPTATASTVDVVGDGDSTADQAVMRWPSWSMVLPGAAHYDAFYAIGHCLFALIAGVIGLPIARRFASSGARAEATQAQGADAAPAAITGPLAVESPPA
jgi:hypothetical protein